jgi:hypothetical protein
MHCDVDRHQSLRIIVFVLVAAMATACLKLNPDYIDESDGGPCGGDAGQCTDTHYCKDGLCVEKKANGIDCTVAGECASDYCDTICCASDGPCCKEQNACGGKKPFCSPAYQCVECAEHADCQQIIGGWPPVNSPLGLCTPEGVCTCWAENETDNCSASDQCPLDSNFVCASDVPGNDHFSCLRRCTDQSVSFGMACVDRMTVEAGNVAVWAPVTSCYAFNQLDTSCVGDGDCSVYGSPPYDDGACREQSCTYSCINTVTELADDNWCPQSHTCVAGYEAICRPL